MQRPTRLALLLAGSLVLLGGVAAAVDRREVPIPLHDGAVLLTTTYASRFPGPGALIIPNCRGDRKQYESLAAKLSSSRTHLLSFDYPQGVDGSVGSETLTNRISLALGALLALRNVQPQAPILIAFECGAASAIEHAAKIGDARAIVLIAPQLTRLGEREKELFDKVANVPLFLAATIGNGASAEEAKRLFASNRSLRSQLLLSQGNEGDVELFAKDSGLKSKIEAWLDDVLTKPL